MKARSSSRISLGEVLAQHDRYASVEHARTDNLGDGFLLAHSALYRALRASAMGLGVRMSVQDRHGSGGWPLGSLRALLTHRELPYVDNVRVLRRELKEAPGALGLRDLLALPPAANYLAHESAHVVAFTTWFGGSVGELTFDRALSPRARRAKILRTQLCESFANASELWAQIEPLSGPGELFARCGFYGHVGTLVRDALHRLRDVCGAPRAFAICVLAFLHGNFLYRRTTLADRRRALSLLEVTPRDAARISSATSIVFRQALRLNPAFLLSTSAVYFRQMGLEIALLRALDFSCLGELEKNDELRVQLASLSEIAA